MTATADATSRIVNVVTMTAVPIADTAQMKRLADFASDVMQLAAKRPDLELREPIDELHADLLLLRGDED
jgi:hypothetical protein